MPQHHSRFDLLQAFMTALLLCSLSVANAQETHSPSAFSLMLNVGFNGPSSKGLLGSRDTFELQFSKNFTASQFPFGDNLATSSTWGGEIAYRFAGLHFGPLAGIQCTSFSLVDPQSNEIRLSLWTFTLGGEYSFGEFEDRWNAFGRLGINRSSVEGSVYARTIFSSPQAPEPATVTFKRGWRTGFEGEIGARYNLKGLPLSFEAAANFTDANLGGKSYEKPTAQPPDPPEEVDLNDAPDPTNSTDSGRAISYVSIRIGARVRF